ncbi:MAG: UxaA family hydrolase [Actinomycetota bacterium]|nr:UxaA family hydrolase [Actinomycetota bacterium]
MSDELAFLGHQQGDSVAVAVRDVEAGKARLAFLDSEDQIEITTTEPIPLGHKVALVAIPADTSIIEYGEIIGSSRSEIAVGSLVHIHNIRSNRWQIKA